MKKSIEQTYQKKTPLEHVLLRPDTYVGSVEMEKSHKWVLPKDASHFEYREICYVPALYKMFDQVLVNAADNYQRDKKMNLLKVQVNQEEGFVSVLNNGTGIPVQIHKQYNMYVPELIFGHLLTGSNYNDDQRKVVGGRNGYGAKLANIFSVKFIVECGDGNLGRKFKMTWKNNMKQHSEAQISKYSGKDYTSVTFYPDFNRFGMKRLDDDIFTLFTKRAYDMAGLMPRVKVVVNGKDIIANSFSKYVDLYFGEDSEMPKIRDSEVDNQRWQIIVSISQGQFKQVSFVNNICTSRGGTHVDYITNQIVEKIQQKIKKKDKNLDVKPFLIKSHLWVFVSALIQNPTFDSQTKQTLKLKASDFGSTCTLSDKMIKSILKSGIVDQIFNEAKAKQLSKFAKIAKGGKKQRVQGIPKLEDANQAGGRNSQKCTLILTQGDSAKSLAMAGLQVIGRDNYGVFPLKGKLLNVRQANSQTLLKNLQIQNLIKIIGFQVSKQYSQVKGLRYGSIMIMADQDSDGSHIKGLIVNFIHHFWPSLFKINGFLKQFITPLLKVTKNSQTISFFTVKDFKDWSQSIPDLKRWKIKYYKGLGTSTDKEAKEYFESIQRHKIDFQYIDGDDDDSIQLVFSKKNIQKRKQWLSNYNENATIDYNRPRIRYKQFVDRELIHFSNSDNIRSIASIIDGFKPGQRKIIYSCFKRNLKQEIKVAQLAGYVAEHSAYHHGQMSLNQTIVGMAQNFVGSNNIHLLMPNGQFGSRNQGGKDHASARYIFTCLNKVTRYIYPEADDHTLTYIEDDGQLVQPEYYMPIIPMGLVNGCEGIGTGWSTNVPNFNPRQIADLIFRKLQNYEEQFPEIDPWYKGFIGQIVRRDSKYEVKGIIEIDQQNSLVHIKQLPVGKWIKDQKQYIQKLMEDNENIVGLRQYHTRLRVHFQIQVKPQFIQDHKDDIQYFAKLFKTNGSISMSNMVGFNQRKTLQRYSKVSEVLNQFFVIRLKFYQKRKEYLLSKIKRELQILQMKQRFILQVVQQKLIVRNVKKVKLCQTLLNTGYTKFSNFTEIKSTKKHGAKAKKSDQNKQEGGNQQQNEVAQGTNSITSEYNYLLSMPIWNLTFEKVEEIKKQRKQKQGQYLVLKATSEAEIWKTDLNAFLKVLDEVQRQQQQEIQKGAKKVKANGKQKKVRKKAEKAKKDKKDGPINWDTQSQKSVEKQKAKKGSDEKPKKQKKKNENQKTSSKTKKQSKKKGKGKKQESDTNGSESEDDLISRIKKKSLKQDKNESASSDLEPVTITRPKKSIKSMLEIHKDDQSDFQYVQVSKKSKRKMDIDSDESYSESQQFDE